MSLSTRLILILAAVAAFVAAPCGRKADAAGVRILSPAQGQCVPGPDVTVHFQLDCVGTSPGGCNLHWVLDGGPFQAQFDTGHPHIFRDVPPGTHTIRVFACDPAHKAIPGTFDMVTFHVMYANDENRPAANMPLLTYNLPQGEYRGIDAADVALDFLVTGGELCPGGWFHVNYYVDGRRFVADTPGPRYLKGLKPGPHKIRMELVDKRGRLIGGPFNSVERTILLSPQKTLVRLEPGSEGPAQPTLQSIPGAMTQGLPWMASGAPDDAETPAGTAAPGRAPAAPSADGFAVRPPSRPETVARVPSAPPAAPRSAPTDDEIDDEMAELMEEIAAESEVSPRSDVQPALEPAPAPTPANGTPAPTPAPADRATTAAQAAPARPAATAAPTTVTLRTTAVSTTETLVEARTSTGEVRVTTATATATTATAAQAKPTTGTAPQARATTATAAAAKPTTPTATQQPNVVSPPAQRPAAPPQASAPEGNRGERRDRAERGERPDRAPREGDEAAGPRRPRREDGAPSADGGERRQGRGPRERRDNPQDGQTGDN